MTKKFIYMRYINVVLMDQFLIDRSSVQILKANPRLEAIDRKI